MIVEHPLDRWVDGCYHVVMPTKSYRSDPRLTSTQISIRVPYMYREQLQREADKRGMSLPALVVETLERVHRPVPLKPLAVIDNEAE